MVVLALLEPLGGILEPEKAPVAAVATTQELAAQGQQEPLLVVEEEEEEEAPILVVQVGLEAVVKSESGVGRRNGRWT